MMERKEENFRKKMRKLSIAFRENIFAKCVNFVKTMSFIAATINSPKELMEFSALIAQYFKFYYVL